MNFTCINILPKFIRDKLDGRAVLQKTIINTGWLFADHILRMGVGFFVVIWVARYLGPEQFGIYNYAIAFVALFSAVATLGLDNIVVRDIVKYPESANEILGTALILKIIGGVLALCLTIGAIFMIRPYDNLTRWMVCIIAAGVLFQPFDTIDFWFRSQIQSKYTVYAKSTAFLLASIGKVGLILMKAPLIAFAWIGLTEVAIGAAGLIAVYRIKDRHIRDFMVKFGRAKKLLSDSWPLILAGFAIMIYIRVDQIMLGEMIGSDVVGIYSAAVKLSEVWYFIPMVIISSVFPSIIASKKESEELYYERLQKLYNLMTWLAIGVALPISFASDRIIALLFGKEFITSGPILSLHIWAAIFVFQGVARGAWFLSENYMIYSFVYTGIGAIVNIVANLILIPSYGAMGAAYGTIIANAIAATLLPAVSGKTRVATIMLLKAFVLRK